MGRPPRNSQGGFVYHVIARGLKTKPIFRTEDDYQELIDVLIEAVERFEAKLLAYCLLPKHWHLVLTPRRDGDLSKLMAWVMITHSARWHTKPRRSGTGGLYERRFKSFPVQDTSPVAGPEPPLLEILRFVESHAVRAGLVASAQEWRWSSLQSRLQTGAVPANLISAAPIVIPLNWLDQLNGEMNEEKRLAIVQSIQRGAPYGDGAWVQKTATRMGLESTLRPRGRPKKIT